MSDIVFSVETGKFRSLLSTAFLYRSDTIMDNITSYFDSSGVVIQDVVPPGLAAIHIVISPSFFKEYQASKDRRKVNITQSLFHIISRKFKNDEVVSVKITDNTIFINGKIEKYQEDLLNPKDETPFNFNLKKTEYGILPEHALETSRIVAQVPIQEFSNLEDTKAHNYIITTEDSHLVAMTRGAGIYSITINPKQYKKLDETRLFLNANYFDRIVNNLSGDVWFLSDGNAISVSQLTTDVAILIMLATEEETTT